MGLNEQTATAAHFADGARPRNVPFRLLTIAFGGALVIRAACLLPVARLDAGLLVLALMTVVVSSRVAVRIPHTAGRITVSDTLILLTLLLYGGEAAILLAAAEGVCSSLRISRKALTVLFNGAVMGGSTCVTAWVVTLCFGPVAERLHDRPAAFVSLLSVMALAQYATNSGLVALDKALKLGEPAWAVWRRYYLWTSLTYFAGATAAGVVARLTVHVGFFPVIATTPIIAILYFTYQTYLRSVESAAAQAAQAERHVEELNRHLAEQERISRELQESREHFRNAALHDTLTGLPNRALLMNHLKLAIDHARGRPDYLFAALFLDLDRFKVVNDSLGHTIGDRLLVEIARRLEACVRHSDIVARLGGDEFAVLLASLDDFADATRVAERIHEELARPFHLGSHEVYTTASIGITLSSTGYREPEDILRDADTVMYRAKANGKARHEVFDEAMHARAVALLKLETDLRRAVERREFRVHYQPIVSLSTGAVTGFEALVRWQHPERGLIPPAEFIPVAEETGLITEIGRRVLEESCRQLRLWQERGLVAPALAVSVNLSGKQFAQPDLVEEIERTLGGAGLAPHCLTLEITESVIMGHADSASASLKGLRDLGVGLSLDDFGTGYSSLSYLHRFPVNTLKIDRSFISRMGPGGGNTEIVRAIITLASGLGMGVVAEGVETVEQREQLRALGCEFGQGYLFSKPLDGEAATRWLLASRPAPAGETLPA